MIATDFRFIPFIDIPMYLFLMALMVMKIFKAYGANIDNQNLNNFFKKYI